MELGQGAASSPTSLQTADALKPLRCKTDAGVAFVLCIHIIRA